MNKLYLTLSLIFCLQLLMPSGTKAQQTYSITGIAIDKKGGPIPGATVFLTNTKYSTATNSAGKFSISGIEAGNYEVVIKMVGFVPYVNKVSVGTSSAWVNATLIEDNVLLNTVTVKSTDPNREKYLQQFIKYFIGESANAAKCKILDPEVLNFHYDKNTGILTASADKLLAIENDGLGYKLNYLLTGFKFDTKNLVFSYTGYPYFEELKGTGPQQKKWDKNREEAYLGSERHFFRSIYDHTSFARGFYLYSTTDKAMRDMPENTLPVLSADSIFALTDFNNLKVLRAAYNKKTAADTSALYVLYHGDKAVYEYVDNRKYAAPPTAIYNKSSSSNFTGGGLSTVTVIPGTRVKSPVTLTSKDQLSKLEPLTDTIFIDRNGTVIPQNGFLISGYWAGQKMAEMLPLDYRADDLVQPVSALAGKDGGALDTIAARLEGLAATRPTEKAYVQFNKPSYNIGDTIWFKGYVMAGGHHQPSALSGILYVELIGPKDKVIKSLQLKNNNGIAAGDFTIDDKFTPGNYRIRAYTTWMRNAGPDYFFNQTISIGNIKTSAVFIAPAIDVSAKNSEGLINAKLSYTDKFGRPFDHKAVGYEVKADTTTLFKGTGITDDKGNLSFAFSDKAAGGQKRANVVNHIKLAGGVTIDKTIPVSLQKENVDIQFFPEGGQLVNDVRSKVAFKAIGTNGLGADVKGIITDNENNEVAEFTTQHAGMGVFAITPQAGKTYTAKITLSDNTTLTAKLPAAQEKGFVLAVNNNPNDSTKLNVRITTNAATLADRKGAAFYLVGQSGETIYYTTLGKLDNLSFTAPVPKNKFPAGIAQFTLFSNTSEPLNERVVFIRNNNDLLNLELKTEKTSYKPKEKVDMAFSSKDNANKPITGSFSLTVYNEDRLTANENAESTILSNILLTSDLKGYIEEPNYYFNGPNDQTNADLDVLMLTQGYRRFEWKEIMDNRYPQVTYQPEKSLSISGTLTSSSDKPVAKGKLSVLALSAKTVIDTTTDAQGRFILNNVEFPDSTKLVIQARKANDGRNVNISLDNTRTIPVIYKSNIADAAENDTPPFLRMAGNEGANEKADTSQLAANIKANTVLTGKQLKEVDIKEKKENAPTIYNRNGSVAQFNLNMAQAMNYNSAYEAIQYRIPGVTFKNGKLYYEGKSEGDIIKKAIINGIEYSITDLKIIAPADVEHISLISSTFTSLPVVIVSTKSYAGTDTIKLKNFNKPIDFNKNNTLKAVTIKEHIVDKPDKSNLWGSTRPLVIVSGKTLEDYVNIVHGLIVKVMEIHYNKGKIFDAIQVPPKPTPIPVVIDGVLMNNNDNIDDHVIASNIEDLKVVQGPGFKPLYGISPDDRNDKVIIITTRQFAGTINAGEKPDTLKNNAIAGNKGKTLKDVTIKGHKIDKPDKSNLYGSKPPEKIISGEKMQEMAMTMMGLEANVPNILPKDGKIYDASPEAQEQARREHQPLPPIPIVLNGSPINVKVDDIDALVTADQIENVKILQGNEFKVLYGIPYENPNDRIIVITTKQFAGTGGTGEKADTLKNNGLKKVALNEVTVKSRKNAGTELNPWQATVTASANLNGPGRADQVVGAASLEDCLLLSDCLQAKIPGIIKQGDNIFFARHMAQSVTSTPPIVFMVDGITLGSSLDMLDNNIIVSMIQTIEVLNSSSYLNVYGTAASGGLLVITTKVGSAATNDAIAYKSVPGVIYTKFNGFYKAKEFYMPKYTVENVNTPDNRTAVYWNPNIVTGNTGQLPIEYFNSDVKGTYRAVVEGIDNDGNIGRFVYRYRVQ